MTATTNLPDIEEAPEPVRISWMESLGFSQSTSVWSDRPVVQPGVLASPATADTVADWTPTEVGTALTKGKIRWGLLVTLLIIGSGVTLGGLWLYQRPAANAQAASASVAAEATNLASVLPGLVSANASIVDGVVDSEALIAVDQAARSLFDASSGLSDEPTSRSAAADAASMALDAVRLINDANAYQLAVTPVLIAPALETDHEVIALDEAARAFGDWQLGFDSVRTALPDGVMSDVTTQLDILSGNLASSLEAYVDALRLDDSEAAAAALDSLANELDAIGAAMTDALAEVQIRASARIEDSKAALDLLVG